MQSSLQRRGVAAAHGQAGVQGFDRPRPCRRFVSSLVTSQQAELVARPRLAHNVKPPCTRTYAAAAGYGAADDGLPSRVQSLLTSKYDREIWALALPALMSMLLDPLMMMMGSAIVGHLGTQQLAAVSMASLAVAFSSFMFSFLVFLTTPKVAAAAQQKNDALVSRIASNGIWLAAGIGLASCFGLFFFAKDIVGLLNPPEPAVALYAEQFIKARAPGALAVLLSFVASGTYRGLKDTKTPLYASIGSTLTNLVLHLLFIYGFSWGVAGSGLAMSMANWVSCGTLTLLLIRKGRLRLPDLAVPPSLQEVGTMMRAGVVLSARVLISFGMVMYASALCVRMGSTTQASFEVVRQVWMITIQFFECLNVATQALCSSYLGAGDVDNARGVINRVMFMGCSIGAIAGAVVFGFQDILVAVFTNDAAVKLAAMATLPMVCLLFPMDAAASIMDGCLLAAQQHDFLASTQIAGSIVQFAALSYLVSNGMINVLTVWGVLKLLTVFRTIGGVYANFLSPQSAYIKAKEQ